MSNSKGNQYPVWGINDKDQVFAVDTNGTTHNMSNENFASSIGIAEDGTVWVLSMIPDPDGGGARLFWSNGDSIWNEINTPDPGGVDISGGLGSNCFYRTFDGEIRTMSTGGTGRSYYNGKYISAFDYGGGMVWALMPETEGGIPCLQFANVDVLQWKPFAGNPEPSSISVDYQGNCQAINDADPVYYSKDGVSTGSSGTGVNGKAFIISSKTWTFLMSTELNENGNLFYEWQDIAGGTYMPMAARGSRIAASHYSKA